MTMPRNIVLNVIVSILCLFTVTVFLSIDKLVQLLVDIDPLYFSLAFMTIFANIALSSLRFQGLMTSFSLPVPLLIAHRINILSQFIGLFTLQTWGQMAFRSLYGGVFVTNSERLVFVTVLEKLTAILTLMLLAAFGSYYLTHEFNFSVNRGLALFLSLLVLLVSFVLTYSHVLTSGQRRYVRLLRKYFRQIHLRKTTLLSLAMHLLMLTSYLVISKSYLPDGDLQVSAAIFSVVMLGAAVPISFAGWGVRELSAGFIFSFVGLDPTIGIIVSAAIGVLSLIALGLHGVLLNFITSKKIDASKLMDVKLQKFHVERGVALFVGVSVAILIGIQARLPTDSDALTINLADPVACVAAIIYCTIWYREYLHQAIWRVDALGLAVTFFVVMMGFGLVNGYLRHGFIDWAWFNRGIGQLVIMAYLFTGAMVVGFLGEKSRKLVLRVFLITAVCSLVIYCLTIGVLDQETLDGLQWIKVHYSGFLGNRNAQAFVFVLLLAAALPTRVPIWGRRRLLFISLVLSFIMMTESRTGMGTSVLLLAMAVYFKCLSFRKMAGALAVAAMSALALPYVLTTIEYLIHIVSNLIHVVSTLKLKATNPSEILGTLKAINPSEILETFFDLEKQKASITRVDTDRVLNYRWGFETWLTNPVFGAGLGSFISEYRDPLGRPLTIHNTGLWVLAEMGVVGFVLLLALPLAILNHVRKTKFRTMADEDLALLFFLVAAVVFSQTHEISFQRILWFMLGLLAANPLRLHDTLTRRWNAIFDQAPKQL